MPHVETSEPAGALDGKVALVTGGASGIGRAIATLFAMEGAAVCVMDLDPDGARRAADEIQDAGGRVISVAGDVSAAADCERAVHATVDALGGLDVLVNNAGIIRRATVLELDEASWDRVMDVNVRSVYLLSRLAIPIMAAAGGGAIVNTGSGWGLVGGPKAASYCASKGAVVQLTRAMAIDHGPVNIRVNCVCPGDTDTPLLRDEATQLGSAPDDFLAGAADRPLRRIGTPDDIARAALYLASDAASFVTGAVLVVDGGGLAGR
jgi:NAD(P)-dependent dehydrogenase (short-subunit alcohol dehydrogenase family)